MRMDASVLVAKAFMPTRALRKYLRGSLFTKVVSLTAGSIR